MRNEFIAFLIKDIKKEMESRNNKFVNIFIYYDLLNCEDTVNGQNIFTLGLLNDSICVLGIKVELEWFQNDNLSVNTIISYKGKEDSFLMDQEIKSQPIVNDYVELIFLLTKKIYGFLVFDDIDNGGDVESLNIDDYYDELYN